MEYRSMIKMPASSHSSGFFGSGFKGTLLSTTGKLTESVVNEPIKQVDEGLTLEMQNTFEKKKNEELQA